MEDYFLFLVITLIWSYLNVAYKNAYLLIGYLLLIIGLNMLMSIAKLKCGGNPLNVLSPWIMFLAIVYVLEDGKMLAVFENTFGNAWLYFSNAEQDIQTSVLTEALNKKIDVQGVQVVSNSILSKANLRNIDSFIGEWGKLGLTLDVDKVHRILSIKECISKTIWYVLTGVFVLSVINMNISTMNALCGSSDTKIRLKPDEDEEAKLVNIYD